MSIRTIRGPTKDSDLGADVLECDACGLEVVIGDHRTAGHVITLPDGWDNGAHVNVCPECKAATAVE